jgi:hypothetical protein
MIFIDLICPLRPLRFPLRPLREKFARRNDQKKEILPRPKARSE